MAAFRWDNTRVAGPLPNRLFHFTSAKHALDDLRNRRLKIAQFDDLNDPFELKCVDLSGDGHEAAFDRFKAEMALKFGVVCFNERWDNILHWSHYADRHRGACLGFDVSGSVEKFGPVNYKPDKLSFPSDPSHLDKSFVWELLRTKFEEWVYEHEWRVFARLQDGTWSDCAKRLLYFAEFSDELVLREVILGADSPVQPCEIHEAIRDYPDPGAIAVRRIQLSTAAFKGT